MKRNTVPVTASRVPQSGSPLQEISGQVPTGRPLASSHVAVDEAKREGVVLSIQRCLGDPSMGIDDLEDVLVHTYKISEAKRAAPS